MNKLTKYAQHFVKLELMKTRLEVFQNESGPPSQDYGRAGRKVDFIIKTNTENLHEVYLQPINLEQDRSVKIPKQELGEPKDNLWVALVLFMKEMEPVLYLIPSKTLAKPDDFVFLENEVSSFPHLSNWEIKIFKNGMQKLNDFSLENMLKDL